MPQHAAAEIGRDRRQGTNRIAVGRPSTVRARDHAPRDVMIENLSSSGFLFRSDAPLPVGTRLHVGLAGGGMAQAQVVRVDDKGHGCEFAQPLTPAQWYGAFRGGSVVEGAFPTFAASRVVPYDDARWPGAVRLGLLFGGGAVCWLGLVGLGALLF